MIDFDKYKNSKLFDDSKLIEFRRINKKKKRLSRIKKRIKSRKKRKKWYYENFDNKRVF